MCYNVLMPKRLFSWNALVLNVLTLALLCACKPPDSPVASAAKHASPTTTVSAAEHASPTPIVSGAKHASPAPIAFGAEAMDYVRYQVGLGSRPPGSAASRALAQDFQKRLHSWGYRTEFQDFTADTPHGPIAMRNVVATWSGARPERYIVAAHYDTKVFRDFAFVGANDGASGTAVALELGHILSQAPLSHTLQLVLLDGEEAFEQWTEEDSLYGSRHFVKQLVESGEDRQVRGVIILDMVGDKSMLITQEQLSDTELRQTMNQAAAELHLSHYFPPRRAQALDDDHRPFLEAGIPALDIIGLYMSGLGSTEPAYWHTAEDTIDKVDPHSLGVCASVVLRMLRLLDESE